MREVDVAVITDNIKEMCIEANHYLTDDMKKVFNEAVDTEESPLGKQVLNQLKENLEIAGNDMIPICQDTGMAVVFINVGQDVHLTGGDITDAINEGVRRGYVDGYLRKSVVADPIYRENTASCLLSPNRVSCSMIAASSIGAPLVVLYRNTIVRIPYFVNRGNDY